jgi:micrococcal nuclease
MKKWLKKLPLNKNIYLYLAPLLVVFALIFSENQLTTFENQKTFEQKAEKTTSVYEIDTSVFEKAKVKSVIDGDTIELVDGQKVRYLLIDTPETVHPKKKVQCYGREASQKNKELVDGKDIFLEKDISETDRYGRKLRYVYLSNRDNPSEVIMVNEYLIEKGYAQVVTYPPDVKYKERFLKVQRMAQDEKKGLWGSCQN